MHDNDKMNLKLEIKCGFDGNERQIACACMHACACAAAVAGTIEFKAGN